MSRAGYRQPDRYLVAHYERPRRWDVVTLRVPGRAATELVRRVVGLPGEQVVVRDGAVWIDGRRLEPPSELGDLHFSADRSEQPDVMWGTEQNPAQLGPGEYFVLGDFSERSPDSRTWTAGAEGHPPYAVPESNITGVVTHICWPLDRWRILR